MQKPRASIRVAVALLACSPAALPRLTAAETPQDMLAVQVRLRGFVCDKAVGARQDIKRSRPDHDVWIVKCSNASYRVSRAPDMLAKVEPLQ